MKKKIIEFKDFSFQYRVQAEPTVKNINLSIYEGEKVLIVGPSGSGKSTLAHCINGLVPFFYDGIVTGQLNINGNDATKMNIFELSKIVGTVLQDPDSQFIGLTVGEDIAFKLENYCISQDEMIDRVDKSAELVDIKKELYSSPYKLSGGQKQRVTLAGVTVDDVKILLFDEPLASLDPATGESAIELIDKMQKQNNKTAIIIEHRLEDVLHCDVDRVIVMDKGEIIADTTIDEIIRKDILRKVGIREPLYLTALRYADCEINDTLKLKNIETLELGEYKEKLKDWYENIEVYESDENQNPILELDNICFSYNNEKQILKNVSFKINKGDIAAIVGRNGAGKSTFCNVLCGLLPEESGEIIYEGRKLGKRARTKLFGMVMQDVNHQLFSDSVKNECLLADEDATDEQISELLGGFDLAEFAENHPKTLSGGQRQRLAVCQAVMGGKRLLIFDEPTSGLDYRHMCQVGELLRKLAADGHIILVVTHDYEFLNMTCGRYISIDR